MLALDCETTGVDLFHGAKPFFVTIAYDHRPDEPDFFQWDVDPLTREPKVPARDVAWIKNVLKLSDNWSKGFDDETADRHCIVMQNGRFDIRALSTIGITSFPWQQMNDTLLASHLLSSNTPHDLTSLALTYLGLNIQPLEDKLRKACNQARSLARRKLPDWAIAKKDRPDMPSAKGSKKKDKKGGTEQESCWKFDCWLPRTIAQHLDYPKSHPWWTVLQEYANADSTVTVQLWPVMKTLLKKRGLWKIWQERRKLLPIAYRMEQRGVTVIDANLQEMYQEFLEASKEDAAVCIQLAAELGYKLQLPRGTSLNKNTREFFQTKLCLAPVVRTKKGATSYNKAAMSIYANTLEQGSPALAFVRSLLDKRKVDTALAYMKSYQRYWLSLPALGVHVLHPSLNPTGTDTLRWSCRNPNEQNISKQDGRNIRYCFGPEPGYEWWAFDAANLELRFPAYYAGEEDMIQLFERPKDPPYYGSNHLLNFHTVYPDIWAEVERKVGPEKVGLVCKEIFGATWYQYAKNGGFAVQYGAIERDGGVGTADRAFHRPGSHAKLKARFQKIHGPGGLNEQLIRLARKQGYIETIPDRSVDPDHGYPLLCSRTESGDILPTVPLNYWSQGTAMWWTSRGMVRVDEKLEEWRTYNGFDAYIVMQIHDEIDVAMPYKANLGNLWRAQEIAKLLEQGGKDLGVPTPVSIKYHQHNWAKGVSAAAA